MALEDSGIVQDATQDEPSGDSWVMPNSDSLNHGDVSSVSAKPIERGVINDPRMANSVKAIPMVEIKSAPVPNPTSVPQSHPASPAISPTMPVNSETVSTISPSDNSIMPNPDKHSSVGKFVGVLVLLIFLVAIGFMGFVYADDNGIYTSGISAKTSKLPLSSLWGGLSAIPQTASEQIAATSSDHFHYTGSIKGWGSVENFTTVTQNTSDPFMYSGSFNFAANGTDLLFNYQISSGSNNLTTEYRNVAGIPYFGTNISAGDNSQLTWSKADTDFKSSAKALGGQLASLVSKSSFIGHEKLNSGDTYHFKTSVGSSDLEMISGYPALSEWENASGVVDIWVSRKSHIVQRFRIGLSNATDVSKTITMEANINSVVEKIEAPADFSGEKVGSNMTTTKTNDQLRKEDIAKVQVALNKYFSDRASYPIAATIENLSEPKSVLNSALVPLYLDNMPRDPVGVHYYGYKSDGKDYELTAVLDDSTDPEGMQVGAVFIIKITSRSSVVPTVTPSATSATN